MIIHTIPKTVIMDMVIIMNGNNCFSQSLETVKTEKWNIEELVIVRYIKGKFFLALSEKEKMEVLNNKTNRKESLLFLRGKHLLELLETHDSMMD